MHARSGRPGLRLAIALTLLIYPGATFVSAAEPNAAPAAVPSGYSIAVAASQPLVKRPLFAALDDAGALYVLESGGANGNDRREKPSDLIRRLTDENGDGVYDRAEVFAEGIVFGAGLAWHDGALFVTSPPSLWKFEDRDRDGTAERRTELVTAFAFNQSCTDDAHGAVLGPDGRIYFLPGRFPHRIQAPNGSVVREGYGPWLMRCRPDGSEIEVVGGAVGNPVEVAFSAAGDAFVQGTFWAKPSVGDGLRDAVIHAIPGGEYSVRDRDYTDRIRTGDFLPALVPLTATAPSGLAVVRGAELGDESQGALFTSHFNTGKILRHRLRDNGATFSTQAEDFVVANNRDVHFTDVLEDADGSLLVVDTGGWYLACCPASGSARPNILGGIYRVSRDGAKRPADPSGRELAWDDASIDSLIERLDDDRWRVRDRAIAALAKRGGAAIEALQKTLKDDASSTRAKLAATWTLCRIDAPAAREIARIALDDSSAEVRQAAASSAALHRDAGALEKLVERLADPAPRVRREAAHALGRIGDSNAVAPLLQAVSDAANALPTKGDDGAAGRRFAEHALIFSLIEIDAPEVTRAGLASDDPNVRRAALVALDQSPNGNLQPAEVAAALATSDEALRQAAAAILQRRAEWSEQSIDLVETWLGEAEIDDARANAIAGVIRTLSDDARLRKIVAQRLAAQDKTSPAARLALLAALAAHDGRDVPNDWRSGVAAALGSRDPAVRAAGLRVVERWKLTSARDRVRELAADVNSTPSDRLAALRTLTSLDESLRANEFDYLLTRLNAEVPVQERLAALDVIAAIPHEAARLQRLLPRIGEASPIELPPLLQAFARGSDAKVGERLVAAISEASVAPSLDLVQSTLKSYPAEVQQAAAPLIERLRNAAQAQVARLDELESQLNETPGDAARGGELFFAKAQCHLCHAARGRGGRVGPDLTAIGDIRSRRGLLEAIVFPSASFARGYEPIVVELHDGRVLTGLAGRESPEEFVLITVRDNKPAESPLKRDEIAEIQLARVSAMPQGLDAPLTRQELADLTAYLQGLRAGGSPTLGGN